MSSLKRISRYNKDKGLLHKKIKQQPGRGRLRNTDLHILPLRRAKIRINISSSEKVINLKQKFK